MKIVGKYIKHLFNMKGQAELSILVPNLMHSKHLAELDEEKLYRIEIKEVKSKRSIQQNSYMWALLSELEKVTKQDSEDWYIFALKDAKIRPQYMVAEDTPEMEKTLKSVFRVVRKIAKRNDIANNAMGYHCYVGSSKFNTKEMSELLEHILRYCAEYNIQTDVMLYE